jgi:hypothetical protein
MNKTHKYVGIAILAITATLSAQAPAPAQTEAGYHKHDGFYLNLMGGIGAIGFSEAAGTTTNTISGLAGHFGLKLGAALSNNWILFGAVDSYAAVNPTYKTGGTSVTYNNTTYGITSFGAGIAYYTDSNFFVAASAGAAKGTVSYTSGSTSLSSSTDTGFGANLNIGMEWWVSKDWGIGSAAVGNFSSVKDGPYTATQFYGGVSFTASYN